MSLYGALFGGVSGLRAQSSKIGVISDNIANVNTIGYKQGSANFQSLVINSSNAGSYQTGGVRGGTSLNISKQGLLQSTDSATDIAISGGGFFVVRSAAVAVQGDSSSTPYYTRAGSFTQDSLGNFVNSQGFFLQGWPLDREGRLPGEPGNLNTTSFTNFDSLEAVNVESASGTAQATSEVEIGANLKASETVFPGEGGTLVPDDTDSVNRNLSASAVIVSSEYGLASTNSMRRGDSFSVSTGGGQQFAFEYGGYTIGRKITSAGSNYGDNGLDNKALLDFDANGDIDFVTGTSSLDLTIPDHGLITGDTITLSGFAADLGATPFAQLNATHTVTWIDADTVRITTATAHGATAGDAIPADAYTADTRQFSGNIFDASTTTQTFFNQIGVSGFTTASMSFSISTSGGITKTFTYTASAPNTLNGEFNNLNTLASAIDSSTGLTARVVDGRLVVSSEDATEGVQFENGDVTGAADGSKRGIDWIGELDLAEVSSSSDRFNSLQSLADLVNATDDLSAVINNPLSSASLEILVNNPLETIQFDDLANVANVAIGIGDDVTVTAGTYTAGQDIPVTIEGVLPGTIAVGDEIYLSGITVAGTGLPGALPNGGPFTVTAITGTDFTVALKANQDLTLAGGTVVTTTAGVTSFANQSNQGSVLAALGLVDTLNGTSYATAGPQTFGGDTVKYDPTGVNGQNMSSGDITAQFSRNVRVYDALGSGHDVRFSFIKIGENSWAAEVHAIPESDISTELVDGQIAVGTITFNGDGTLRSVSPSLINPVDVTWTNGAIASRIGLNLGTAGQAFGTPGASIIGLADGMSQFDSGYNVNFANQNGAPVGQLVSVAITEDGTVVASYSNGETQALYKLPLADFANPDGLVARTGNIFAQTRDSGEVNLREAGTNGTGSIVAAALEQSNVDLAEELTDMIVAQRAYQANTRVIKVTDELLEQLNQI